jgi:hypothetical protein
VKVLVGALPLRGTIEAVRVFVEVLKVLVEARVLVM